MNKKLVIIGLSILIFAIGLLYYVSVSNIQPTTINLPEYYYGKGMTTVIASKEIYFMYGMILCLIGTVPISLGLKGKQG